MVKLKNVVITGAGSGLGASLAFKYNELGNHVTLIGRTKEKLEHVAKTFNNSNYSIYTLDISSFDDVKKVFSKIAKNIGPIDILINSAGVGYFDLAEKLENKQVNQMIDVNLKGTIYCTQQVLLSMKERNSGSIINIISTAGSEGKIEESAYCASKFGVRGFTESLVQELNETKIHVHGVYMGGMKTPFWDGILDDEDMAGLMDPNDIADIIISNATERPNITVPKMLIKNH